MARWAGLILVLGLSPLGWSVGFVSGDWDLTLRLLPAIKLYESELTLTFTLAGFEIESGSTFYHDGLRYQSFDLSGGLGQFELFGSISFHVQDIRYRKAWLTLETDLGEGDLLLGANHWSAPGEYTSSDRDKFGVWPCANAILWNEAWKHIGRTLYVEGPVASYEHAGYLRLYVGRTYPDPERFEVYISASNVPKFEEAFGSRFWEKLVGKTICVYGGIKDQRYTAPPAHSVPQVTVSSASNFALTTCCGYQPDTACPSPVIRWYEALGRVGETLYVQGPIVSLVSGNTILRIGGGGTIPNRLEVRYAGGFDPAIWKVNQEVCVFGTVTVVGGVAHIELADIAHLQNGPCCEAGLLPGYFLNHRARFTWAPFTVTVDFGDCCTGTTFRRLTVELGSLPFPCCGLLLDASLAFTKCRGWEELSVSVGGLRLGCCDLTFALDLRLTPDAKTVSLQPKWGGGSGCVTVYGDVVWDGTTLGGFAIYGWGISCYFDRVKLRLVTAPDPDKVEDMTDVTFYVDEFEYVGITYTGEGCCGGTVTFGAEMWFGAKGTLFGLQRTRFELEVPLSSAITVFAKGQWNFAKASPLEWFDVGWDISF